MWKERLFLLVQKKSLLFIKEVIYSLSNKVLKKCLINIQYYKKFDVLELHIIIKLEGPKFHSHYYINL